MTEVPPGAGPVDRLVTGSRVREWEVVRFVARGAFGQVFEARRDSWVENEPARALKVFDPILSSAARSTLLNEFTVLRTIRHPNLVAGEDAFDLADGDLAGSVVFVMELADTDLASVVARQGPVETAQVAAVGADVARGLHALHDAGHLHGDVKPENVLVAGGTWKLGDFGVSTALQGSYAHPGGATLDFRPPEVSEADTASRVHRSADIWALGVTLWMAATGSHPYVGADSQLRYAAVLRGDRRAAPSTLDRRFVELLDRRCLTSDPHRRSDAAELAQALDELADRLAADPIDPVGPARSGFVAPPPPPGAETLPSAAPPRGEESVAPTVADRPAVAPPPGPRSPVDEPTVPVDPTARWPAPPPPVAAPVEPPPSAAAPFEQRPAQAPSTQVPGEPPAAAGLPPALASTPSGPPTGAPEPYPTAVPERSGRRPWWFGAVVGAAGAAVTVEVSSLLAAAAPGGLGVRRAVYGVLVAIVAVAAGLLARRQGWTQDPVATATRAGAAAAVVVALVSTIVLFAVVGQ